MTSTNFTVGMPENTRPSSRVLKPPGGESTLVFSDPGYEQPNPYRHPNYRQQQNNENVVVENISGDIKLQEGAEKPTEISTVTDSEEKAVEPTIKAAGGTVDESVPPRRGRIPPGGYSSGLW